MVWSRSWVDAFPVRRRFDTADRSIVISSDTSFTQATIDAWHACDVLIHEASRLESLTKRPDVQPYAAKYHTNTRQLAELASKGKPRLLIIYHASIVLRPALRPQASSPEELLTRSALRVQRASNRGGDRSTNLGRYLQSCDRRFLQTSRLPAGRAHQLFAPARLVVGR